MDRLLRPKVFQTEASDPNAEKLYRHWKMTFQNYLETFIPAVAANDENAEEVAEASARKRMYALFNNISAELIFELVSECNEYDSAIQVLDTAYIKPTSVVYNRHKLITCKQDSSQSIDRFKKKLQRLAKTCKFQAVSAEENKQQYIRDAFINGISSPHIRQRLLENVGELSLLMMPSHKPKH